MQYNFEGFVIEVDDTVFKREVPAGTVLANVTLTPERGAHHPDAYWYVFVDYLGDTAAFADNLDVNPPAAAGDPLVVRAFRDIDFGDVSEFQIALTITYSADGNSEETLGQTVFDVDVTETGEPLVEAAPVIEIAADRVEFEGGSVDIPRYGLYAKADAVDMDGDGDLDIVVNDGSSGDKFDWYANDGEGNISGTPVTTTLGVYVHSFEFADVDGDGAKDLITTSNGNGETDPADQGRVDWYAGNGDGTFATTGQQISGGILNPLDSVAVDFDGDGDIDVLSTGGNEARQVVLATNDGNGNFTTTELAIGAVNSHPIRVADMNDDGLLDIITGGATSMGSSGFGVGAAAVVSINNGDGTFTDTTLAVTTSGNPSVWDVEIADLNGDGILDVVTTNPNSASVVWFAGIGDGTYAAAVNVGGDQWNGRTDTALGDIDGDGDIDIVTTESESANWPMPISWFENDGSGNFTEHRTSAVAEAESSVVLADIDGNGTLDIVRGGRTGNSAEGREDRAADVEFGYKVLEVTENAATQIRAISLGGLDDSAPVILTLSVPRGTLTGNTVAGVTLTQTADGLELAGTVADINAYLAGGNVTFTTDADDETDLVLTVTASSSGGESEQAVRLDVTPEPDAPVIDVAGDGVQFESPTVAIPGGGSSSFTASGDMDGDGDLDLVVIQRFGGNVEWFANDGAGNFSATANLVAAAVPGGYHLEVADLDGDGITDVLATRTIDDNGSQDGSGNVTLYRGLGDGTFAAGQNVISNARYLQNSIVVDLDGDGHNDVLAIANHENEQVIWAQNNGDGTYTQQVIATGTVSQSDFAVGDLDGDGNLDIVTSGSRELIDGISYGASLSIGLANGDGTFTSTRLNVGERGIANTVLADMDGDGDLDILASIPDEGRIALFTNDGEGSFGAAQTLVTTNTSDFAVGDIDGDGDIDIIGRDSVANGSFRYVSLYENNGDNTFTEQVTSTLVASSTNYNLELADMNGDGVLDIVRGGRAGTTAANRTAATVAITREEIDVGENQPTGLTGISFSGLAATAAITVTLAVDSGTLAATASGGVAVIGTDSSVTLSGTVANINSYLAGGGAVFTTDLDNEDTVRLSVSADNQGAVSRQTVLLDIGATDFPPTDLLLTGNNVDENSALGTLVGTLSATDPEGSAITYTLTGNAGGLFELVGNEIRVAGALDHETAETLTITAVAADAGGKTVSQDFTITIGDVDEAPVSIALSRNEIGERAEIGSVVGTLSAIDPEGGAVTYTLSDNAAGLFEIVGNELRVKAELDYETAAQHQVTVVASDANGNQSSQTFDIDVLDQEDGVLRVTIDASGAGAAGMDLHTYLTSTSDGFLAGATSGGFPVFDNGPEFVGEEMFIGYGSDPTSKYVLGHGDLSYYFGTHTVHGTINTIEFGTRGSGTYDSNGYFTDGNAELRITGLDFYNAQSPEAEVELNGEVHNFSVAMMNGASATQARLNLFEAHLAQTAQHFIGSEGDDIYTGTMFDDLIEGGDGNDWLDGGDGADTMIGGAGDDTYVVGAGDVVVELEGGGIDTVQTALAHKLRANVENLTLTGTDGVNGRGNELDNIIIGNDGDNALSGEAGDDILIGGAGNDRLIGGEGADTMEGGDGNDTYFVDNLGDLVVESGTGIDTVNSTISYTLTDNVERLRLSGTADIDGTGNALANVIVGNDGDNVLAGGLGVDRLIGEEGDDTFLFDTVAAFDNRDRIDDFGLGDDVITLDSAVFTALSAGALTADEFFVGTQAQTANQHIIYNDARGVVMYDADGSGAGAAVRLVALTGNPTLSASDFLVV